MLDWLVLVLVCYIVGSIPTAYLLGRWMLGIDIRTVGFRNAGTANAWKHMGARAGIIVLLLDVGKGVAAVSIARKLVPGDAGAMTAGFAAVVGHNWPAFLKFHGGRGAATAIGVLSTVLPYATLPLALLAIIPLWITKRFMVALYYIFLPLPFVAWYLHAPVHLIILCVALPIVVWASDELAKILWPVKAADGTPEATRSA